MIKQLLTCLSLYKYDKIWLQEVRPFKTTRMLKDGNCILNLHFNSTTLVLAYVLKRTRSVFLYRISSSTFFSSAFYFLYTPENKSPVIYFALISMNI